jgi:hypothetical protein
VVAAVDAAGVALVVCYSRGQSSYRNRESVDLTAADIKPRPGRDIFWQHS